MKSFLGNFYRHLATFYWSHCLPRTFYYYCPLKIESRVREFRICFRTKTNSIRNAIPDCKNESNLIPAFTDRKGTRRRGGGIKREDSHMEKKFRRRSVWPDWAILKGLSNKFRFKSRPKLATFWIILKNDIQIYCGYFLEYFHWIYSSNVFALFPLYLRPLF